MGKHMKAPSVLMGNYEKSGSKIENLLEGDHHRISTSQIEEGMKSKEEIAADLYAKSQVKQVEVKKVAIDAKKDEMKKKQAFNQMAVHFHDDDVYDESWD